MISVRMVDGIAQIQRDGDETTTSRARKNSKRLVRSPRSGQIRRVSTVSEIEHAADRLSPEEFAELACWIERRRAERFGSAPMMLRDHAAFLNSYAPEDEGLYDDGPAR